MESAPKDGSYVIVFYQSLHDHNEHWNGRAFVARHEGVHDGYDMGWGLFPGYGGVSDKNLSHWAPLPTP